MKKIYFLLIALLVTEIIIGAICAPYSCDWGNNVFFITGIILLLLAFLFAVFQNTWSLVKRIGLGLLCMLIIIVVWLACFMLFNFTLMCRMF